MRTELCFELTCSICGNKLSADLDKSEFKGGSAFSAKSTMAIKPCATCYAAAKEPAEMIKMALSKIQSEIGNDRYK